MQKIPDLLKNKARELRTSGLSHREVSRLLGIGQGSVVALCKDIKLSSGQHLTLMRRSYQRGLGKISLEKRHQASVKGGQNTKIHFKTKYSRKQLIALIKAFFKSSGRIPTKRDFVSQYRPMLRIFTAWNKAIEAAGFTPNPVLFSKKFRANDGHLCDSLSEKIIDDWFAARKIPHERNVVYPGTKFTADFKVNDTLIEFFGLHGQLKSYDEYEQKKLKIVRSQGLKLIAIYPSDIFPESRLDTILTGM